MKKGGFQGHPLKAEECGRSTSGGALDGRLFWTTKWILNLHKIYKSRVREIWVEEIN